MSSNAGVALNLQQAGEYSQFLFPSKIMTYLSYDLLVVSTRDESIINSKVANLITFANDFNVHSISEAIESVNLNDNTDRYIYLYEFDRNFETEFINLIREIDGNM